MARQSGRCHHPHIPVRRRRACSSSGPCCCRAQPRRPLYFESGIIQRKRHAAGSGAVRPCRAATIKFAQSRVSVRGSGGVAPAQDRAAPARATARTRVCATPSREMCGANIGSRLLRASTRGVLQSRHTLSSEAPISTCSWPNLCTRYALRVRTHREIHTLRSLSGGR